MVCIAIVRPAFERQRLEEEGSRDIVSVSLNPKERERLEELKEILNVKADSKALKFGMLIGRNVIQSVFGAKLARFLFKTDREKLEDFKAF